MRVLVLGGTNFIGPHVVHALISAGHDVTVFNRGKSPVELPAAVTRLEGDRGADVSALVGLRFDATIDMCGFFPRALHSVLDALDDAGYYCFVSTISVYANFGECGQDESAPLAVLEDESVEEVTGETYGGLKALCERVVFQRTEQHSILRLGLVVGPGDRSDRFTYWPVRFSRGRRMLAPRSPREPMQWIDARDVADFIVRSVQGAVCGTFNIVTPPGAHTLGSVLAAAYSATGASTEIVWLEDEELQRYEISAWSDLPAWMSSSGDNAGFAAIDNRRAVANGLRFRALKTTTNDLLEWWSSQPEKRRHLRTGLGEEREQEIADSVADSKPIVSFTPAGREAEIAGLLEVAFGGADEKTLVDRLRRDAEELVEVLVSCGQEIVGYVAYSPLDVSPDGVGAWALAPMAVAPDWQNRGIGRLLSEVGNEACRASGADVICVLGHPDFYPRLGFDARLASAIQSEYSGAGDAWMALELTPNSAQRIDEVRFHPAFAEVGHE